MPQRPRIKPNPNRRAEVTSLKKWATEKSGYDPSKFYTSASDGQGHGRAVRFDAPPSIVGEIAELLASGQFPAYRSAADFWRDAAIHRLHFLADNLNDRSLAASLHEYLAIAEVFSETDRLSRQAADLERLLNDIDTVQARLRRLEIPGTIFEDYLDRVTEIAADLPQVMRRKVLAKVKQLRP